MAGRMDHVIYEDVIVYVFTTCDNNLCFINCLPIVFISVATLGPAYDTIYTTIVTMYCSRNTFPPVITLRQIFITFPTVILLAVAMVFNMLVKSSSSCGSGIVSKCSIMECNTATMDLVMSHDAMKILNYTSCIIELNCSWCPPIIGNFFYHIGNSMSNFLMK